MIEGYKERAAYDIGYIEGRVSMYNEIMEIISVMYVSNGFVQHKWDISRRTLEFLENRINNEIII